MMGKIDLLLSNTGDVALRRRAYWIVDQLDLSDRKKILDAGCGDGFYLYLLSNLNSKIELAGVDADANALKTAQKNLKDKKIKLVIGNVASLPFKNSTFDTIIASEVLEHVDDDLKVLKEFMRVLKPDGRIVVSVPNANYPFFWDPINWLLERLFHIHVSSGFFSGIWNQHRRLYSKGRLLSLFKKSDCYGVKLEQLTHYCLPFNHYLINIVARLLANRRLKSNLKTKLNKFQKNEKSNQSLLFQLIFLFDKLNEFWDGKGSAVSLVVTAVKK